MCEKSIYIVGRFRDYNPKGSPISGLHSLFVNDASNAYSPRAQSRCVVPSSRLAQASRSVAVRCMIAGDDRRRRCRGRGQTGSGCEETRARAGGVSVDKVLLRDRWTATHRQKEGRHRSAGESKNRCCVVLPVRS